jgi:hypothetical protein
VLNSNPVTNMKFNYNTRFNSVQTGPAASVQTQRVVARLVNDTGLNKSINWALMANGSNCSPACGTLGTATTTVNANGTTVRSVITYTPPTSVPTGTGQSQPTLMATSAGDGTKTDSFSFTITDGTCGTGHESVLNGQYAFLLRGGAAPGGYLALIGSITADGTGKITGGTTDGNTTGFGPLTDLTILTASMGSLPASSYSVGADNRGCLTLTDTGGGFQVFRFSLGTVVNNVATEGRIIKFDDNTFRGRAQSGVLMKQDPTSFNAGALNGNYVFGEVGVDSNGGRFASAGLITSNSGTLSNISGDYDDAGTVGSLTSGSGSYSITTATGSPNGRGTATTTTTITNPSSTGTSHLVLYMVSPSETLFMTTDFASTNAILTGELKKQAGPFPTTTLDSKDYVFYVEGVNRTTGGNDTVLGQTTFTTNGNATITIDENNNGVMQTEQTGPAVFTVASNGRTTISGLGGGNPILYLIDANSAFLVGTDNSVAFGYLEIQTGGPFSTASISGPFFFGGDAPTTGVSYDSGTVNLDGVGTATGTDDSSGPNGLKVDVLSGINGAYSFSNTSTPRGKGTVGTNSIAYIISGSKLVFMSTGTDPKVVVIQK